jgi:hypothetical protein
LNRGALVAGFLILVFALALGLLLQDPAPLPGALDPVVRPGVNADEDRPAAGSADGELAAADDVERSDQQPGIVVADGDPAADGATIRVRTVSADDGEPIPGALVRVLDVPVSERGAAENARSLAPGLHGLLAEATGWRTGADGAVQVPRPSGLLVVDASGDGRYAQRLIDVDRPVAEVTLELALDRAVRARVVDSQGLPVADIPVVLQTRTSRWSRNEMLLRTDAKGRVRFAHAQAAMSRAANGEDWLAVALPGMPDVSLQLDAASEDLEDEKLLRLPDTGRVTVRVLDHDGRPFPRPATVVLRTTQPDDDGARFRYEPRVGQGQTETVDGVAVFSHVGVGVRLLAAARLDASDRWYSVAAEGPAAPGDAVEMVLTRDSLQPEVRFRVLRPDGTPLADAQIAVTERGRTDRSSSERSRRRTTDADGWMLYAPRQGQLAPMVERSLELRWFASRDQAAWTGRQGLSFDLPPGTSDLGGVTLQPPSLVAAGSVTGPRGEPVVNALVRVYVQREDSRPGRMRWRLHPGGETRSDDQGRFSIAGELPDSPLQLRASHPAYLPGATPGTAGGPNHQIVLTAGLRLAGRLLAEDPAMYGHLAVSFLPDGADATGNRNWFRGGQRKDVEDDGRFDFGAMSEQRGMLQVLDRRSGMVLLEVPDVSPWPADGPADGRFDPLDLRGRMEQVVARFVDMERVPVRDVRYSIMLPGEEESWWSRTRDGSAELFAPIGGLDLLVRTDGYREILLRGVRGEREIVLEPAIKLRFELQPGGLANEFQLDLRLRRESDGPNLDPSRLRLDSGGRGEATASSPGPIQIYLRVRYTDAQGRAVSRYVNFGELGRRMRYEVRDSVGVQVVPLRVSRDDVLRAMDL